jgi:hypothetical protein
MANEVEVIPTTIDYTDRDFYSIRAALIERIKDRTENAWQGTDPNDFGMAIVEAFAYMGDVMSYYIDRVANEMSLESANQRDSILNISRMFGYTPAGFQSATCEVTFTNSSASAVTLPVGTQLSGQYVNGDTVINIIFETLEEAIVPATGSVVVNAAHGENVSLRPGNAEENGTAGEGLGASNGSANQEYRLLENQVVEDSVRVFVLRNETYEEWTFIDNLIDAADTDSVFTTYTDANNFVYVVFGDGITGKIPTTNASIKAQYVVGGGSVGRIPANALNAIFRIPGVPNFSAIASVLAITNTAAIGGSDPESSSTIRKNAPFALRAMKRAVSLEDYANLALGSTVVSKANASADTFTSVTTYVAPAAEDSAQDPYPGYDPVTYEDEFEDNTIANALNSLVWEAVSAAAEAELQDRLQIGVTATIAPPTYVPVELEIKYAKEEQYADAEIESTMRSILSSKYGFNNVSFAQTLYPEEIEYWLRFTPGVKNVTVAQINRLGATAVRLPLVCAANEIPIIRASSVVIEPLSSDSTPSALALSGITISPTFAPETTAYTATTTNSSTTLTLTDIAGMSVTAGLSGALYAYNPTAVITLTTGPNVIQAVCVSEDKLTTTTYTITVTKS